MDAGRIAALLAPFLGEELLSEHEIHRITIYMDLLLRWNARMNLTAVRDPEQIVTRHFGESFFAARQVLPHHSAEAQSSIGFRINDIGSGAGFPGLPLKIWAPDVELTLSEANSKKATFLRELVRALELAGVDVWDGRAEDYGETAGLVTLRAVEKLERILPVAAGLVRQGGRLALLIGAAQVNHVQQVLPQLRWNKPVAIPLSKARVVLVGNNQQRDESN